MALCQNIRCRIRDQQADKSRDQRDCEAVAESSQRVGVSEKSGEIGKCKLPLPIRERIVKKHEKRGNDEQQKEQRIRNTQSFSGELENANSIVPTISLIVVMMSLTVESISLNLLVFFLSSSSSKDKLFILPIGTSSFLNFFDINGLD